MMTVAQLRETLAGLPDDMPVVMAKDEEGNGYSPLDEVDPHRHYYAESTWSGEIRHPDDIEDDDQPDHIVVVLWPTN